MNTSIIITPNVHSKNIVKNQIIYTLTKPEVKKVNPIVKK